MYRGERIASAWCQQALNRIKGWQTNLMRMLFVCGRVLQDNCKTGKGQMLGTSMFLPVGCHRWKHVAITGLDCPRLFLLRRA